MEPASSLSNLSPSSILCEAWGQGGGWDQNWRRQSMPLVAFHHAYITLFCPFQSPIPTPGANPSRPCYLFFFKALSLGYKNEDGCTLCGSGLRHILNNVNRAHFLST